MITPDAPARPLPADVVARWSGTLDADLLAPLPRGRRRRWVYAAAGDDRSIVGAAAFHAGVLGLGTSFAFAVVDGKAHTWDASPGRAGEVVGVDGRAVVERRDGRVEIDGGSFTIDVPVADGRIRAEITAAPISPVSLVTPTPRGGWNATTKAAGHACRGTVSVPGASAPLDGHGWTDATDGRQDRVTTWRWVAGAGTSVDGRSVGLQGSTGMNGLHLGEDLVWWDGVPYPLGIETMRPAVAGAFDGAWKLAGPGWGLRLAAAGARSANERVGPIASSYHQPIGTWSGTLPGPDGAPVEVTLRGVAEDHEARW